MHRTTLFLLSLLSLGSGCASLAKYKNIEVDGFKVKQMWVDDAFQKVSTRASFEMGCPKEELKLTILSSPGLYPDSIGVEGCGKRSVYVGDPISEQWFLNSDTREVEKAE